MLEVVQGMHAFMRIPLGSGVLQLCHPLQEGWEMLRGPCACPPLVRLFPQSRSLGGTASAHPAFWRAHKHLLCPRYQSPQTSGASSRRGGCGWAIQTCSSPCAPLLCKRPAQEEADSEKPWSGIHAKQEGGGNRRTFPF